MNGYKGFAFLLCMCFLSGCIPVSKVLEDVQLIQAIGYDYVNEKEFQVTAGATYTPPGIQSKPQNVALTAVGRTSKHIRQEIQAQSPRPIEIGRVGVILFDEELARSGIDDLVDNLQRDPNIGRDISLVVSKGKSNEILSAEPEQHESVSQFVIDIVKQNMERTIPSINLHHFLFHYRGLGFDPFLPLIEKKGDLIQVSGVALFKGDHLAETIDLKEGYILKILYEKIRKGIIEIDLKEDKQVSIQNLSSNTKFKPEKTPNGYRFNVNIKMDGRVMEGGGLDLTQKKNIEKLEKKTEQMLEKEALVLLEKLQKLNVDPLGIKEELRQEGYKDWKKQYGSVHFKVDANVHLIQAGIME
ncbi:Ger(x)C family spore germination protein [Metabacillus idriensis]|uniref:Ger(x)C family spore germination protein n=1 Tax=Metabacillus idriensis TaxID=324768 RepID=UPI003D2DFC50